MGNWPRCKNLASPGVDEAWVFHKLLTNCRDWLTPVQGINEMPHIFLHLAGKHGPAQTFSLSPWSFVIMAKAEIVEHITARLFPGVTVSENIPTGQTVEICQATF